MLPEKYLARIGHVVLAFEQLERNLSVILTGFVSPNIFVGIIVTREVGFRELVRLIKAIHVQLYKEDDHFHQLKKILEEAKAVKTLRDKMVHSSFTHVAKPEENADYIFRFKVTAKEKHGYQRHTEKMTLADLDKVISQIKKVNSALLDWADGMITANKTPYIKMAR